MPYVRCPHCMLLTYTAASFTGVDRCPGCESLLTPSPEDFARRVQVSRPGHSADRGEPPRRRAREDRD